MDEDRFIQSAYAYLYLGLYNEALASFVRAMEANPRQPEPYFHASITAHRNGLLEDAGRWAMQAIELAPEEPQYRENWASVRASQLLESSRSAFFHGDTEAAIRLLKQALAHDPLHLDAHRQLDEFCRLFPEVCAQIEEETFDQPTHSNCNCWGERPHG